MINISVVKVLLLLSIVFVPFASQAKVLPKYLFEKALQESKNGDFIQAEKDWSSYLNENPNVKKRARYFKTSKLNLTRNYSKNSIFYLVPLICGLISTFSLPPYNFFFLNFISFPFLLLIYLNLKIKKGFSSFLYGWIYF